MTSHNFEDGINIELTKRAARQYADAHELSDIPILVIVPDCTCNAGLDDTTADLKCPVCGRFGVEKL